MKNQISIYSIISNGYLKTIRMLFSIIIIITLSFACSSQRIWTYSPESKVMRDVIRNNSVAVPPFIDKRINENSNKTGLAFLPLFPFGWQTMHTPEGAQMHITSGLWLFNPTEDFAKAVAIELENSSIFKEVFFTHRPREAELSLIGTVESTKYKGKLYTYLLSFYGVYLWFVGLPAGTASNELALSFKLQDNRSNEVLWKSSYTKSIKNTSWIYSLRPDFNYDKMLKEIMREAIPSLKQKLPRG